MFEGERKFDGRTYDRLQTSMIRAAMRYMRDFGCSNCGAKPQNLALLELHHMEEPRRSPLTGKRPKSWSTGPYDVCIAELTKCTPLCKTCHAGHHRNRRKLKDDLRRFTLTELYVIAEQRGYFFEIPAMRAGVI